MKNHVNLIKQHRRVVLPIGLSRRCADNLLYSSAARKGDGVSLLFVPTRSGGMEIKMELRDVIKILRQEIGVTQAELASALHISIPTVSRWELGKSKPNRAVASLLLGYAYTHNVQRNTTDMLKKALSDTQKKTIRDNVFAGMMATEHTSLAECFDVFPFPIYVCDVGTDMVLYANGLALKMMSTGEDNITEQKCYECLMHRDSPCTFCHKAVLTEDKFTQHKAIREFDGKVYYVYGKLIRWNGHDAQIRFAVAKENKPV